VGWFACVCVCVFVHLPLGGGLMSVSPCWLELSDCPDSAQKREQGEKRKSHMVRIRFVCDEKKRKNNEKHTGKCTMSL